MIYVLLPAYNEEREIHRLLGGIVTAMWATGRACRVLVVDDGSSDGTALEARRAAEEFGGSLALAVVRHEVNGGLGASLRTGIHWCLERADDDDIIVTMDADNTHSPTQIPALLSKIDQGMDLAIASRYQRGSTTMGVPAHRRLLSLFGRLLVQRLFPLPGVRDYTCCFRAYRASLLRRALALHGDALCSSPGFEAVMDLLLQLRPLEPRTAEIPLQLNYSGRLGRSKMDVRGTVLSTLSLLGRRLREPAPGSAVSGTADMPGEPAGAATRASLGISLAAGAAQAAQAAAGTDRAASSPAGSAAGAGGSAGAANTSDPSGTAGLGGSDLRFPPAPGSPEQSDLPDPEPDDAN